jgi:hypothetical protein
MRRIFPIGRFCRKQPSELLDNVCVLSIANWRRTKVTAGMLPMAAQLDASDL